SLIKKHIGVWRNLWKEADTKIEGDRFAQRVIRLHSYHLMSTFSKHSRVMKIGVPARGLHGESYHGHIFWDNIYILPFFLHRFPEVAKSMLLYRYDTLDAAKQYARENGFSGAMYPWQSAESGKEET